MQAIILAAGQGTRLRPLTLETPKTLLEIKAGVSIADKLIESLPPEVEEILFVVNFFKEKIKARYGNEFGGRTIKYVEQPNLDGTAKAVWQCKDFLKKDFLVINGDDIYDRKDLEKLLDYDFAMLTAEREGVPVKYLLIKDKADNLVVALDNVAPKEIEKYTLKYNLPKDRHLINAGAYKLTKDFFNYKPVLIDKEKKEYGLPQTLMKITGKQNGPKVKILKASNYFQINNLEDLEKARDKF